MKILSVGWFDRESNTSLHRHKALVKNFKTVDKVDCATKLTFYYRIANKLFGYGFPISLPDFSNANEKVIRLLRENDYDFVWIDKGITINRSTLEYIKIKNERTKIIGFSPDNMVLRHNQSQNYLESFDLYDAHITTKSYIINDLIKLGAKRVIFTNQTFQEDFHIPQVLSEKEKAQFAAQIGFVGVWEKERCDSILFLVDNGMEVTVYGDGRWNEYKHYSPLLKIKPGVFSSDYPKVLNALKISLCFLRKINFDQHTSRSIEIPACGGFMLAERTDEHLSLFQEGDEAEYFSSNEELLEKCRYYLKNENERIKIVEKGIHRCKISGYSNSETIKRLVYEIIDKGKN